MKRREIRDSRGNLIMVLEYDADAVVTEAVEAITLDGGDCRITIYLPQKSPPRPAEPPSRSPAGE